MKRRTFLWTISLLLLTAGWGLAAEWQAGVAKTDVTPGKLLWMSGFAARKHPAEGTEHPLWAKALVLMDSRGERVVLVTLDLIGDEFGRELADAVAPRVQRRTGIARERIVFNASHTHCGPVTRVSDGALVTYPMNEGQRQDVTGYCQTLVDKLAVLIEQACNCMAPVQLAYGQGQASFGKNRRQRHNPHGPVDHSVPVLRVSNEAGRPVAVVFGYACHCTTLGGSFYRYNGDYAGFAQIALQQAHPGSTAMFVAGCGADVNPDPRGTLELAQQHGASLAAAVEQTLTGVLQPVSGLLKVGFQRVDLPFVEPPTKEELEKRRGQGNLYEQRLTEVLLTRIAKQGALESSFSCPVQVIQLGDECVFVALGGEVVVDYALRLRRELDLRHVWVAGYCNEILAYIPSERVLAEGGYEAGGAMRYFGWHGPFRPGVEERVISTVRSLLEQ